MVDDAAPASMPGEVTPDGRAYLTADGTAGQPLTDAVTVHAWHKHEPVTVGATPVWVCARCRIYRTQEPLPYDLGECAR